VPAERRAVSPTIEDGVAAQRLAEAATESWQSGQVVRL
jgi:predicted dehydrogenase